MSYVLRVLCITLYTSSCESHHGGLCQQEPGGGRAEVSHLESIWKTINARMFLQGSPAHDQGVFVLGILVFAISVFSMFWIDKKSNVIFQHPKVVEVDNPVPVEM